MPDETEFVEILTMLDKANVRFVVIGGVAMRLQGAAHVTDDVDICYARTPENLANIAQSLSRHHARLRGVPEDLPFVLDVRTLKSAFNLTLTTDLGNIDILGDAAGVDSFEGLWERGVTLDLGGLSVRVASIDDLIAMKRAANRVKDQTHILELMALRDLIAREGTKP